MANETFHVSAKNRRFSSPVLGTIVYGMAMDYYNAPQWLWGVVGVLVTLYWILCIAEIVLHKPKIVEFTKEGWKIRE